MRNPDPPSSSLIGKKEEHEMSDQDLARPPARVETDDKATAGWQPIATAPKSTLVLAMYLSAAGMGVCWARDAHHERHGWFTKNGAALPGTPTHWMPIPLPLPDAGGRIGSIQKEHEDLTRVDGSRHGVASEWVTTATGDSLRVNNERKKQMKPSLGRIVLFGQLDSNNASEHPAMITRVWSDECVNLTVFPDCGAPVSKTSVVLRPEGTVAQYYWRWPDRV